MFMKILLATVVVVVVVVAAAAAAVAAAVAVAVTVMFAHSYIVINSHERAREESYALAKTSVLSRRRNAATDSWSSRSDDQLWL